MGNATMEQECTAGMNPLGWRLADYEAWAAGLGLRTFRGRQAARWIFGKGIIDPGLMTDLPEEMKESLRGEFTPALPMEVSRGESSDGTLKLLLELRDGERIEMVLIPEGKRTTLCFSTQVGCPVGCMFCRTGREGLIRNLDPAEIVGQVVLAQKIIGARTAHSSPAGKITNLVIMGMGEPLLNFERVSRAVEVITAPWGLGVTPRRITLSTAGIIPRLGDVRTRFPDINLAVSLNAPDTVLRRRLMPGTAPWPLPDLLKAVGRLPGRSRHPVTFEYVLLGGVNDSPGQARVLARLLKGMGQVNLIPYNQAPGSGFAPPAPEAMAAFALILRQAGLRVTRRKSRGADIQAACGQLRAEHGADSK